MNEHKMLKRELLDACRILYTEGHHDRFLGHVSIRIPGQEAMLMKPNGLGFEEVTVDDIITVDFEGNILAGHQPRHGEFPIHSEVYRRRKDVNCIIHSHPLYTTMLAAMDTRLLPLNHDGVLFVDGIPLFDETSDLIVTKLQGKSLAEKLGESPVVLLKNHGVVVAGESVEAAVMVALHLEKAAQFQLTATVSGRDLVQMNVETARKMQQDVFNNKKRLRDLFDYHRRKADRKLER